jgi:hypothetical protein
MAGKRRSRIQRTRTGRRLALSARDIEIFKLLSRYRYLRSTYIHAFVGGASETRFKERLGDLFHEGYLDRPAQQWEFADARCRPVVHELGAGALRVLRDHGEGAGQNTFLSGTAHRQFRHSLMICEALASFELGAHASGSGPRFIAWPEILARAPESVWTSSIPFQLPNSSGGYLVPDGVFGLEYRVGDTRSYRFFALEIDRGTMPVERSDPKQTSYLGKLAAYRAIIAQQVHKTTWGIPNLLVLTMTTNSSRLADMLVKLGNDGIHPAFLFGVSTEQVLARPMPQLLTRPWQRAGLPSLSIAEAR